MVLSVGDRLGSIKVLPDHGTADPHLKAWSRSRFDIQLTI